MQILTASWITNSGFATGLTPTVQITNLSTGDVSTYSMEEVGNGNYKYIFNDYKDSIVYFFNYDSGSDDTLNRYMSSSNNDVRVVYQQATAGGTNASMNAEKEKEKKLIKKIADEVEKRLEKDIIENIEKHINKKHEETLGCFVAVAQTSDVEMLSGGIQHLEEKTVLKIKELEKAIKSIKIPKYDDTKLKALIEKILTQIKDKTDITLIQDSVKELLKRLEGSKSELKEEIKQRTKKKITEKDIKEMQIEALEKSKEFQMLKLMTSPEFISLAEMNE